MTRLGLSCMLLAVLGAGCGEDSDGDTADETVEGEAPDGDEPGAMEGEVPDNECGIDSGYPGDDLCIRPPDPEEGFQIHAGPDDYTDEEQVAKFLLEPGEETTECYFLRTPNTTSKFFMNREIRLRPNSHHLITTIIADDRPDGWGECADSGEAVGTLGGTQNSRESIPVQGADGQPAPENADIGIALGANAQVQLELHFVNPTSEPILRETWLNVYYKPEEEVKRFAQSIFMIGGLDMNVAPQSTEILENSCELSADLRILDMFGHFHANTRRFSAWHVRGDERTLLYESFNWAEPQTFAFDSVNDNPLPDADRMIDGSVSGIVEVQEGDRIEWECEVVNEHDFPLRFGNQAYEADMCNLFGSYVSDPPNPFLMRCYQP